MKKSFIDEMRKMQRKMNRYWQGFDTSPWDVDEEDLSDYRKAWIDAQESDKEFLIAVELPGVDKKDIDLNVADKGVTIKVETSKEKKEVSEDEGKYSYQKRYAGFYRQIPLPENADLGNVKAEYRNGVLKIRIPKLQKSRNAGKKIDIV
jgi:HSP20 family protein